MKATPMKIRIYRFHDKVAVVTYDTETLYITPELARQFAEQLQIYAEDYETTKFSESPLGTTEIGEA